MSRAGLISGSQLEDHYVATFFESIGLFGFVPALPVSVEHFGHYLVVRHLVVHYLPGGRIGERKAYR
jgi:Zn-dependent protease